MPTHLHIQSSYSLMNSTVKIDELVQTAKQLGYDKIALTDDQVMYGVIPFYKACIKAGIQPIIGMTLQIVYENHSRDTFTILAKDQVGYETLLQLSTEIQLSDEAYLPFESFIKYRDGLIVILHIQEESVKEWLRMNDLTNARRWIDFWKNHYHSEDFYMGITNKALVQSDENISILQTLAEQTSVSAVGIPIVTYIHEKERFAFECMQAMKHNQIWSYEDSKIVVDSVTHLQTMEELEYDYRAWPQLIEHTDKIANRCHVEMNFDEQMLPAYPVPNEQTATEYLQSICENGLQNRYANVTEEIQQRLQYELKIINQMGFSDYFLIVWDFIQYAKENHIIVGPGRGSAAGSLVAYVLEITNVDPLEHELLFERFLNPERVTMPDIDIDFSDLRRDEVIDYVREKYGATHVAQIITFGTFAARSLIRELVKTLDISDDDLYFILKEMSRLGSLPIAQYLHQSETLKDYVSQSEKLKTMFRVAVKLEGLPRHISTHAAGVVISKEPLTKHVPLTVGSNETYLTQYAMNELEAIGLLKMDFLGLRNLSLIERILKSIYYTNRQTLNLDEIPVNDEKTFQLLQRGRTNGVFQLESNGMKNVLRELLPNEFADIVAVNALFRPGPMEYIPTYIKRKKGLEQITYPHPDLKDILQDTYGVLIYQEQIMQIAHKIAGFSLGEADILRRAVSKKKESLLAEQRNGFLQGCLKNGYTEQIAKEIFNWIVKFANYGFNKSHAVAYSKISYELAYLKAQYPLNFFSEVMNSIIGDYTKLTNYMREANESGIQVLGPSIQNSYGFYKVESNAIRMGLQTIKGIGHQVIQEVIGVRKQAPFKNLFDFCLRVDLKICNRTVIEALIRAGAFDELYSNRATLLASIDTAMEQGELFKEYKDQPSFFTDALEAEYIEMTDFSQMKKLQDEKDLLGLYISSHPLKNYRSVLNQKGAFTLSRAKTMLGKRNAMTIAIVQEIKVIRTKRGESMAFVTLNDETGILDTVMFPELYRNVNRWLEEEMIVQAIGKIDQRKERIQLVMNDIAQFELESLQEESEKRIYIKVTESLEEEALQNLYEMTKSFKGNVPLIIHLADKKKTYQLQDFYHLNANEDCLRELKRYFGDKNVVFR